MSNNRRDFLKKSALLGLSGLAGSLLGNDKLDGLNQAAQLLSDEPRFLLPGLEYPFDGLEPFIDRQTMDIHYTKHHQAYIDKLNSTPSTLNYKVNDDMLCRQVDANTPAVIRNNLGGYYNHSLFWTLMKPNPKSLPNNPPPGIFSDALTKMFGSVDEFKKQFTEAGMKVFGSGWVWLIEKDFKLKIVTTANQDNPMMQLGPDQGPIILALDVWEHAYYLKHQNKRADYIAAWWNVVNWERAAVRFLNK